MSLVFGQSEFMSETVKEVQLTFVKKVYKKGCVRRTQRKGEMSLSRVGLKNSVNNASILLD